MNKIRIAQIGTSINSHGIYVWQRLIKLTDIFEVVGYALPENEREKFPSCMRIFEGYREMTVEEILSDETITAVSIETEELHLTKYALMAAKAGKHIHMEKPGGQCLADFEELIETVRKNQTVFHTGYMYRYNPMIIDLLDQIKQGDLGEIISVDADMSCIHKKEVREWLSTMKGGLMFFLGCHLIDLIYQIQGKPLNVIPLTRSTGLDGVSSEDFGFTVFEYKNGVSTAKTTNVEKGGFARRSLVVVGSKKTVEIRPLEMFYEDLLLTTTRTDYNGYNWGDMGLRRDCEPFDRYAVMLQGFAKIVRGEIQNPYTLDYELELYKLILKCCEVK